MKYDKIETGVNLRQLRIENKLSPGEVSDIVDKSESHIMQLTVEMLCKFEDVYNADPNTILGIHTSMSEELYAELSMLSMDIRNKLCSSFLEIVKSVKNGQR